jgi:hypothetical protein
VSFAEGVVLMHADHLETFGTDVTYTPAVGPPVDLVGIWDTSDLARGDGRDSISGRLWVLIADLPALPTKNEVLAIDDADYRIVNEPRDYTDGTGGLWLHLRKRA